MPKDYRDGEGLPGLDAAKKPARPRKAKESRPAAPPKPRKRAAPPA